ncbi:DUF5703 family protein [Gordonia sp. DT30]|uniref:DUF5703 family protein n=1 Tax=unclassified Gordonia (in: high G+C Gram-positive bacteria) TaxID=2657482 RepID=UPI003CEE2FEA
MTLRPGNIPAASGRAGARHGARYPRGWEVTSDDFECILVRLPPEVTRVTASMRLSLEAEFGGWELSRVRLYSDGTRKVLLKRRKPSRGQRAEPTGVDRNPMTANDSLPDEDARAC